MRAQEQTNYQVNREQAVQFIGHWCCCLKSGRLFRVKQLLETQDSLFFQGPSLIDPEKTISSSYVRVLHDHDHFFLSGVFPR